jgi:hypothetical protein
MPTISYVSAEEHAALKQEVTALRALIKAYVQSDEEWLPTDLAMKKAGIRSRETLEKHARTSRPGASEKGRITYQKQGRKCLYARSSCIDYALRKLGQPALRD